LDKKREIQKGYKYNVEIWRKNKVKVKQKIEIFIKKLQDENDDDALPSHGVKLT
jgi:hypothetical protein